MNNLFDVLIIALPLVFGSSFLPKLQLIKNNEPINYCLVQQTDFALFLYYRSYLKICNQEDLPLIYRLFILYSTKFMV